MEALARAAVIRIGGAAIVLLALFVALALGTYSASDPTFNVATARAAQNWMGAKGAAFADLSLQLIGAASILIAPPLLIWGWIAAVKGAPLETPPMFWARLALAPLVLLAAAAIASAAPMPADWPFAAGLGGYFGDRIAQGTLGLLGAAAPAAPFVLILGALFATAGFAIICGLTVERLAAAAATAVFLVSAAAGAIAARRQAAHDKTAGAVEGRVCEDGAEDESADDAADESAGDLDEEEEGEEDYEDEEEDDEDDEEWEEEEEEDADETVSAHGKRRIIRKQEKRKQGAREAREAQRKLPVFDAGEYELPPLNLLARPKETRKVISDDALEQNARMLESVLADFGVRGEIVNVRPGPVVTLYELEPAAGVKSSRVIGLADDIARSMSAVAARVAVVPGRNAIGIELPNQDREMVVLRELLAAAEYENSPGDLTLALGKSIGGEPIFADLARMPHLLIAGTTGSGKSVGINTMILSLLFRLPPDRCKLIMVDPKMLELSVYEGIPHLLAPVVTDPKKAVVALKWTVREMEERYRRMSKVGVRNIEGFNKRVREAEEKGETLSRTVHTGYDQETGEPVYETEELEFDPMPFIVVVIDEVADLMMVAGKDIEGMVQRLAQMARAAGIHLIMATQRPSVDVITGTIKANFPTRISFQVTSKIDSRTILGEQGAEQLLGQGDMLYMAGGGRIRRVHGAFVADSEVEQIVSFLKKQGKPDYVQEVTELKEGDEEGLDGLDIGGNTSSGDALYDKAVAVVLRDRKASTSYIQRRLQIGYNRAASLMERMEEEGLVSAANHAGKRDILAGEDAA
jgi:S-DNA-T family DNA segregation ATPase FtsK/SpoIIIE